jgi:hypothetical protein
VLVGLISEIDRVPWAGRWKWALSGTRPNPPHFVWKGTEKTLDEARAAQAAAWAAWLEWAGLEQAGTIRWRSA